VLAHTNNNQLDILILCGVFPNSIYPSGNMHPDDSIAEKFLEAGNMIINTADYMFYRSSNWNNGGAGLENMTDIPGVTMWYGGDMNVTSLGQQYLPSLSSYRASRALSLDSLGPPWNVEAVFGQNSEGTLAEPVVMRDTVTGGRLVIFYQLIDDDLPRGEVISEFILNWLPTVVDGSSTPPDGGTLGQIVFDFEDGDLGDWQVVDDVNITEGPASWSIRDSKWELDGKILYQGSNIWGDTSETCVTGTFLIYKGQQFTNFTIDVDVATSDNDGIGLVWAYKGTDRHYRTIMINDSWPGSPSDGVKGPFLKIAKRIANQAPFYELLSVAKDNYVKYPSKQKFHLKLEVNNGVFTITRDDGLTLTATDPSYSTGYVGIQLYAQQGVEFDNFTITPHDGVYIPPDDDVTPPEPGEFVLVGTDPDDSPVANIDQVFASNDADKLTFQVTSYGQWADYVYFSIEMDTDQNPNTGDPDDGVDHLAVVSLDSDGLGGGVFAYDPYTMDFIITDATVFDVICSPNSDLFQLSVMLDDIGNPDAINFEVWMLEFDIVDVAPEIGFYTYVLGGTPVPDIPSPTTRTLSITSGEAAPGSSTTIQLSITDAAGIAGGDIVVRYTPSVVTIGDVTGTSLISGMNLLVNDSILGEITLGMAGTYGISSGSGALVNLPLTISSSAQSGSQTILEIASAEMYNERGVSIPVNVQNGVVDITQVALKGDVNLDGSVRSNDAILALRVATGLMVPTSDQQWAADMNSDGKVRSNDSILILRKAAGLTAPVKGIIAGAAGRVAVSLAEAHGVAGESITVPVKVDSSTGLAGGDICITYDSTVLRAVDVSCDSDVMLASNVSTPGVVSIAFASTDGLGRETLAHIRFDILADAVSPLSFQQVELYSPDALPLNTVCANMEFRSWAVPPDHSALLQNFPNPFNPETWIPYQLRDDQDVTIRVYSAGGEVIRELALGHKSAGLYVSRDRAAYWDGRNSSGEKVASGVYFYSIQAGDFAGVRKLIILE